MNNKYPTGIFLTHGLGDVIMASPLIRELLKKEEKLIIFVKSNLELELISYIFKNEEIRILLFGEKKFTTIFNIFKIRFKSFLFVHGESSFKYALFSFFINAKVKVGGGNSSFIIFNLFYTRTVKQDCSHKVNYYLRFGGFPPIRNYSFKYSSVLIRNQNKKRIIVSPGSGEIERHKRWDNLKWARLIDKIISLKLCDEIIVFGSEREYPLLEDIIQKTNKKDTRIFIPKSIPESFDIIFRSSLVLSVCNGTSHIASLLGVGVVGLYGPTNFTFTGVFGDKFSPIFKGYSCSPCYRKNFIRGCGTPRCMKDIKVDDVIPFIIDGMKGIFHNNRNCIKTKTLKKFTK